MAKGSLKIKLINKKKPYYRFKRTQNKPANDKLTTREEQRLERIKAEGTHRKNDSIKLMQQQPESEEEQVEKTLEMRNEREGEVIGRLIAQKKLTIANAFQFAVLSVRDHTDLNSDQFSWKKGASILKSGLDVFFLKVDSLLKDLTTFGFHMNRRQLAQTKQTPSDQVQIIGPIQIGATLNKKISIDFPNIEQAFDTNPFYQRTKRAFDQSGTKFLMNNYLQIGPDLSTCLFQKPKSSTVQRKGKINWLKSQVNEEVAQDDIATYLTGYFKNTRDKFHTFFIKAYGQQKINRYRQQHISFEVQTVRETFRPWNRGFQQWQEEPRETEQTIQKIQYVKTQQARTLDNIRSIGTGQIKLQWGRMLKQTIDTSKIRFDDSRKEDRKFIRSTKIRRQPDLTPLNIHGNTTYKTFPSTPFHKPTYQLNNSSIFSQHYGQQFYQPIRNIEQNLRKINIKKDSRFTVEQYYKEYSKQDKLPLPKFFVAYLHIVSKGNTAFQL